MVPEKKKRGRKSKKELENIKLQSLLDSSNNVAVEAPKKEQKKRGRKPKGGKIIEITKKPDLTPLSIPNIILHLKCKISDIDEYIISPMESYQFNDFKVDSILSVVNS